MPKLMIATIIMLVSGCARHSAMLSQEALCARVRAPAQWQLARIPGSWAGIHLPTHYVLDRGTWRSQSGAQISISWRLHQDLPWPGGGGAVWAGLAECGHRLGWRMVYFRRWAEFGAEAHPELRYVIEASWQERPDSDLVLVASASDRTEHLQQLEILYSVAEAR
jgi:hypothetical protein